MNLQAFFIFNIQFTCHILIDMIPYVIKMYSLGLFNIINEGCLYKSLKGQIVVTIKKHCMCNMHNKHINLFTFGIPQKRLPTCGVHNMRQNVDILFCTCQDAVMTPCQALGMLWVISRSFIWSAVLKEVSQSIHQEEIPNRQQQHPDMNNIYTERLHILGGALTLCSSQGQCAAVLQLLVQINTVDQGIGHYFLLRWCLNLNSFYPKVCYLLMSANTR